MPPYFQIELFIMLASNFNSYFAILSAFQQDYTLMPTPCILTIFVSISFKYLPLIASFDFKLPRTAGTQSQ